MKNFKLFYLLIALMASTTFAWADDSGTCGDNLTWSYVESTHTLTISGTGAMTDYNFSSNVPWNTYKSSMTTVVIESGATSIGNFAFSMHFNLTSVTIPATVTSIGSFAFEYCSGLTSITIPSSVTSIGNHAFEYCFTLTSFTIPAGVTSIGVQVIASCPNITSISVDANNTVYDSRNNCNAIIETATNKLLSGCKNTIIPATVTRIEEYAFSYCSGLTSITIPEGVTSIGNNAFDHCTGLSSITIPSSVTTIGITVFHSCSGLTSIDIPSSVTTIGGMAFTQCSNLTDVYVNWTDLSGVTIGLYIFQLITLANVNLHLPFGAWESYSGEPWSGFKQVPMITAKADPEHAGVYYNTFYHGSVAYALPAGVEAYTAKRSGTDLILTKIAQAGDVLPAGTAVILKSSVQQFEMTPSEETPVTVGENDLQGVDAAETAPANCYVLSGKASDNSVTGVGFYQFTGQLAAHKAYMVVSGGAGAPKRLRFVFDAATGVESLQPSDVSIQKVMRDGILYIQRGDHLYNIQGVRVE